MHAIIMTSLDGSEAALTDEHAACSYGQPVLVLTGPWPSLFANCGGPGVYGPGDTLSNGLAIEFVREYLDSNLGYEPPDLRTIASYKWHHTPDGDALARQFVALIVPGIHP